MQVLLVPVREHRAHAFSRQPIGAGPYLLDRIIPGQFVALRRNPNFWMAPRPYIDQIVFRRFGDANIMQAAFEAGDIDWMSITPDAVDRVRREMAGRANFRDVPSHGSDSIFFNLEHPILRDRRVREALKLALDRPAIVRSVLNDLGTVIHSNQLITSWATGAPNLNTYAFNPTRAGQLLDEAGWQIPAGQTFRRRDGSPTGELLRLSILHVAGNVIRQDVVAIATRQWREIGVEALDRPTELSVLLDQWRRSVFDLVLIGFFPGVDPDPFALFHSSNAARSPDGRIHGFNLGQFRNAEVDRLIEAGRLTVDIAERIAIYHQVDQILNYELPHIWLFQRTLVRGVARHVQGIVESPIGTIIGEAMFIRR
ncbi:MAG: Oligopeptide-binding protein AppA [Firmicutes bacterium]|nr:Oligopeptide-binding protein AppA [Bacillota bacterium]